MTGSWPYLAWDDVSSATRWTFYALHRRIFHPMRAVLKHHGVPFSQFRSPNDADALAWMARNAPDVLVNFQPWYLKAAALAIPKVAALNTHTAALPKYRGLQPVVRALLAGEREIGVSVHSMTAVIDDGRLLAQGTVPASPSVFDCYRKTFALVPRLLEDAIGVLRSGVDAPPLDPDAPYWGPLTPEECAAFRQRGLRYL